ncbi:RING finger protein 150-like isoform X3 [Limulus polyphemus]|uniref:RING finger protein 150-like isoform X3 n=1 Tax=Limulus polyphemus TaxID=6850 RepID=A0ABM1S147_LIMPO|nr:RING finger protein 150-like isoform X3 [Limulus polyphemus]
MLVQSVPYYLNCKVSWLSCWSWLFKFILILVLIDCFGSFVNCEFTYGYGVQEYTLALINITYTHPLTGRVHSEKSEMGKFNGKIGSADGVVVHVSSNNHTTHDGCNPFDSDITSREPWIALIAHGNCRETIKLQNAMERNASAAVIYTTEFSSFGIKLQHKDGTSMKPNEMGYIRLLLHELIYLPVFDLVSVLISKEDGERIANLVNNGTRVEMHISIGTPNTFRYSNINRTSVLFVSIFFIILMIISLSCLVFYYVQQFRYINAKDILSEANEDFECCAVCIEIFKVAEVVRTLPCKHTFHKSCVDPWLLDQRSCPMCKMDILKYYGLVFTGSQESVLNIDEIDFSHMQDEEEDLESIDVPALQQQHVPSELYLPERQEVRSPCHSISSNLELTLEDFSLYSHVQSPTQSISKASSNSSPAPPFQKDRIFKTDENLFLPVKLMAGSAEQCDRSNNSSSSSQDPLMVTQEKKEVPKEPELV